MDPWLARLSDSVVDYWHANRTVLILAVFTILVLLRIYLHLTVGNEPLHVFPKIYDTDKKIPIVEEKFDVAAPIKSNGPRRIRGELTKRRSTEAQPGRRQIKTLIFYSSLTANTEKIAKEFGKTLAGLFESVPTDPACGLSNPEVLDLAEVDFDEYFITPPKLGEQDDVATELFYLFLLPSYNIDSINDTFIEHLKETHHDFRIDTAPLAPILGYSVFGFGDKEGWPTEEAGYCVQAKELDKWMAKLTGRKRAYPLGMGDVKRDATQRLSEWTNGLLDVLGLLARDGTLGEGVPGSGDAVESDDEADVDDDDGEVVFDDESQSKPPKPKSSGTLDDLEDLGRILQNAKEDGAVKPTPPLAIDFTTSSKRKQPAVQTVKEMVPKGSPTYTSLTKQGYSIVGSHSGVKICRWTKSALRGRGSCYKFSFYGIASHQCMETTPSLSCSNKCVFCWRHGTNPVGTNWRWVVDPPDLIFKGVTENHYKKIKMMRGVPGVRAERFAEAMRIRHCALSLVGEPIFYPHINEFLGMLHGDRISSFLVCNAQHPDQLAALNHVTQLYVSIDASNKESLRKIDRPLHRDFWERFQRCLEILREKRFKQRTVFRLTLVKGFNIEDEAKGYADLVEKALPCFVEVKGVTYCGTSTSSNAGLTMANVPFYAEVCEFVTALERELVSRGLNYGIAAEHAHSCCILLGSERFNVDGKWRTQIDYERFFDLLEEKGPDGDFSPEDYMGPETPEWATWGNGGFDPRDQRVDRKGRPIEI
ncbi:Fe-S oxidoreductase [Cytospora paraplurivora]|uniref:S-adenosyl-L-methionine-dependent tRNA 4-demethylwyosine synthase n=1 Tax=Cytospora paraplurivora TaxID=2898453 RepID=A0AAN9YLW5_9PEZI